ncbi:hypothetical protein UK23_16300 [Lentzea aerocolonigenes]|uniref:SGNH hydrolase-type esterase domain-containing protein n=1 Tax=Lentzea aerocolonigenes TaxID=68170 RepID=A0A0F0GZK7_LENAE|nr:hypothetical protein [Lentzea aerocolonigenes]KJK48725.1 hypothetical protein UK23_16300 [Lentzea aerocolonigenes]
MITRLLTAAALTAASVAVPGGALAAPAPFHDNFDGAVHASPTLGLNDNLKHRQGTGAVTYTRVSAGGSVEVNDPKHPGTLLMRSGPTVVRLDAPSTGTAISAKLVPADSSTVVLSRSANIAGDVTDPAVDLGFLLRANGSVQIYQAGQVVATLDGFAKARSYDVTLKFGSALDLTVNGKRRTVKLEVPTERQWVYLGHSGTAAGLVDDLTIAQLNSDDLRKRPGSTLRYYGYVGASPSTVRGHSNLNLVEVGAATADAGRVDGFVAGDADTARQLKKRFPGKKVVLVVPAAQVDDAFQAPAEVDGVGFRAPCAGYDVLEATMAKLEERVPAKDLFLLPEASPQAPCADLGDPDLAGTQYLYLALIQQYPRYVGFLAAPVPAQFTRTADAQERVAALVLGDARLSG